MRLERSLRPVTLSCLLRSLRPLKFSKVLEINKLMAKITLFWCFEKKIFLNRMMEFQVKFCLHSGLRLWRTGMLFSTKSKGLKSNFRISWMYRYHFCDLKVQFWWPNKCSKHQVLQLNTLYNFKYDFKWNFNYNFKYDFKYDLSTISNTFIKNRSKHNSKTLLSLLQFFMNKSLQFQIWFQMQFRIKFQIGFKYE